MFVVLRWNIIQKNNWTSLRQQKLLFKEEKKNLFLLGVRDLNLVRGKYWREENRDRSEDQSGPILHLQQPSRVKTSALGRKRYFATLTANCPPDINGLRRGITLPHGATAIVDCGFTIIVVPEGIYKTVVELQIILFADNEFWSHPVKHLTGKDEFVSASRNLGKELTWQLNVIKFAKCSLSQF